MRQPAVNTESKNGQSMVELLIALGIAVLIIIALIQSVVMSMKNSQFAKNQNLATRYSQEGIEKVRAVRDSLGWQAFYTAYNGTSKCLGTGDSSTWVDKLTACAINIDNLFTREVSFSDSGGGSQLSIVVTTSWTDNSGSHKSEQKTYLSKW